MKGRVEKSEKSGVLRERDPGQKTGERWQAGLQSTRCGRHEEGQWKGGRKSIHESVESCPGDILFMAVWSQMNHCPMF